MLNMNIFRRLSSHKHVLDMISKGDYGAATKLSNKVDRSLVIKECIDLRMTGFLELYHDDYCLELLVQHADVKFIKECDRNHPNLINDGVLLNIAESVNNAPVIDMCTSDLHSWVKLNNMIVMGQPDHRIEEFFDQFYDQMFTSTHSVLFKLLNNYKRNHLCEHIRNKYKKNIIEI